MCKLKWVFIAAPLLILPFPVHAAVWANHHADSFEGTGHWNYDGTVDVSYDETTPDATPGVWRFTFPKGLVSQDIAMVYLPIPPRTMEMWIQYYYKYSPGFQYHNVVTKQLYCYTTGFGTTHSSNFAVVMDVNRFLRLVTQGSEAATYNPNINEGTWYGDKIGEWHKVKYYFKFNNGNNRDGKYKMWVDDVLVSDYNNVMFDNNPEATGWEAGAIRPIWGGISSLTVPQIQYFYIDGFYIGSTEPGGAPMGKTPMAPKNISIN